MLRSQRAFRDSALLGPTNRDEPRRATGTGSGLDADTLDGLNGTDYLARANHTGAQAIATVTGLQAALDAKLDDSQAGAYGLSFLATATIGDAKTLLALVKGDVGLGNVDNTADAAKAVLSATVLATARTINGISFDGSANITINAVDSTARVPETRTISTTAPITGGGDLSANRTIAITAATSGAAGSMSAADKTKLDAISGTNTGDQTSVSGNAGSATILQTARNFSIGGGGITAATVSFNGSAAVVLSASVDAGHITLARQADVATATVFYRKTAGTGAPEVQTLATLKTDLGLTGTNSGDQTTVSGNAGSATILQTGRTLGITGDLVWTSPSFDGSANVTAGGTLATVNANVGTFGSATQSVQFTVNAKGLITAAANVTIAPAFSSITGKPTTLSGYGITDAQPLDSDLTTIASLAATTDNFIVAVASAWASRTPAQVRATLGPGAWTGPSTFASSSAGATAFSFSGPAANLIFDYLGTGANYIDGASLNIRSGLGADWAKILSTGIEPGSDDAFYLGRNDDDSPKAWKGLILKDQGGTGKYYRLDVFNNALRLVDLTD